MVLVEESVPTQVNVVNLCQLAKPNPLTTDIVPRVLTPGTDSHEEKINPEPTKEKVIFPEASVTHLDPTRLKQSNIYFLLTSPGKSNILNSTIQSKHCYSARTFTSVLKKRRELCTFSSLPPVC